MRLWGYFAFFLLFCGSFGISVHLFPEATEKYSYVEIGVFQAFGGQNTLLEISSTNFYAFFIENPTFALEPVCKPAKKKAPEGIYTKDPKNVGICPNFPHYFCNYWSVGVFTHFFGIQEVEVTGRLGSEEFKEAKSLGNVFPRELFEGFRPMTIEEGRRFYDGYAQQHLERGLSFRKGLEQKVFFGSVQRSGTHALFRTMEEITGEFIRTFPGGLSDPRDQHVLSGEIKGTKNDVTSAFVTHPIIKWATVYSISRQIVTVRNPIVSADSHFHLLASQEHNHLCKIGGTYMLNPFYGKFIEWRAFYGSNILEERKNLMKEKNVPSVFLRYEDLTANPVEVLLTALSFYSGVPADSIFREKTVKLIETKGLASFYRKENRPMSSKKQETVISNLSKYPKTLVQVTYELNPNIMSEFGYQEVYQERLELPVVPSPRVNGLLPFELQNQEVMELLLKYKFDFSLVKNQLKSYQIYRKDKRYSSSEREFDELLKRMFHDYPVNCPTNE